LLLARPPIRSRPQLETGQRRPHGACSPSTVTRPLPLSNACPCRQLARYLLQGITATGLRPDRIPLHGAIAEIDSARLDRSGVVPVWHLTFRANGRNVLFRDEASRLAAVRRLAHKAGTHIVVFCLVDEHVHVAVTGDRSKAGRFSRSILLATRPWTAVALEPAEITPVTNRFHLQRLVPYVLGQPMRHRLPVHPALWSGSCFVDLIGARAIEGLNLLVARLLPRFRLRDALCAVGLPKAELKAPSIDEIRRLGAFRVTQAAAAALCVPHPLQGTTTPTSLARAAACQVAHVAGIPRSELSHSLRITRRAIRKLLNKPINGRVLRSVHRRLGLELLVGGTKDVWRSVPGCDTKGRHPNT
jgi:hypothetical protein